MVRIITFITGYFANDIIELFKRNGRSNNWMVLIFVFVGYLIFREFNK